MATFCYISSKGSQTAIGTFTSPSTPHLYQMDKYVSSREYISFTFKIFYFANTGWVWTFIVTLRNYSYCQFLEFNKFI